MGMCVSCIASCACGMACSCCKGVLNATMPQMARLGHILVIALTFAFAVIIGDNYPNEINGYKSYTKVLLTTDCANAFEEDCIYRQLVYRASFALFLAFLVIGIGSAASDFVNKKFWVLKFFAPAALFIGFWWGDNGFFSGYAEFTRVISFFWLLVQAFLLFDFAHDLHDVVMGKADEADTANDDGGARKWKLFYLVLSLGCLAAVMTGLVFLFRDYSDCDMGAFYSSVTLVMGVITTCISLLDVVRQGFLTPMIMFAYSTFMCWYSLLSSSNTGCNPSANENGGKKKDAAMAIIIVVTATVLLYCVSFGTAILNVFNPNAEAGPVGNSTAKKKSSAELSNVLTTDTRGNNAGGGNDLAKKDDDDDDDDESSGTYDERLYFHVLMLLLICYLTMILTSWGKTNGEPEGFGSDRVGSESMWLKILSQWLFIALQCRALWVNYQNNSE